MVKVIKEAFIVIGKEGSTSDGEGFIQKLWNDANGHFSEVAHLAKKDANGGIVGIWGAMSDFSHSFKPWEDGFSKGLYLAGVECVDHAEAPDGMMQMVISVKWHIWQRKTQTGVLWEYGVPCLIFPIHLNHGKMVSVKACIWQEWNVWIMRKHRMDGPNGQYRVMSISLLKTIRECLKKPLDT